MRRYVALRTGAANFDPCRSAGSSGRSGSRAGLRFDCRRRRCSGRARGPRSWLRRPRRHRRRASCAQCMAASQSRRPLSIAGIELRHRRHIPPCSTLRTRATLRFARPFRRRRARAAEGRGDRVLRSPAHPHGPRTGQRHHPTFGRESRAAPLAHGGAPLHRRRTVAGATAASIRRRPVGDVQHYI